jgi:hypothetical protein
VERYDAADAAAVSLFIREQANLTSALEQYLLLYEELMHEPLATSRTVDRELDQYLRHTAMKMAQMELELAQYRQPDRMEALSDAACAHLRLSIEKCPAFGVCGRMVDVRVEFDNRSSERVGSFLPFPVQLSYRWFKDETDEVVDPEGLRTALQPALSPGEKATYSMKIAAPDEPGRYLLRVTLVQEFLRWLDSLPSPLSAEATIILRRP